VRRDIRAGTPKAYHSGSDGQHLDLPQLARGRQQRDHQRPAQRPAHRIASRIPAVDEIPDDRPEQHVRQQLQGECERRLQSGAVPLEHQQGQSYGRHGGAEPQGEQGRGQSEKRPVRP
jgi:hypothetical protein